GRYFSMRVTANGVPTGLWVQDALDKPARLLLDPSTRFETSDTALNGFVPSPDGRCVAYMTSRAQSRWLDIRVLETSSSADRGVSGLRTNSVSPGLVWTQRSDGFFYTHYDPAPGSGDEKAVPIHPTVRFRRLADRQDTLVFAPPDESGLLVGYAISDD